MAPVIPQDEPTTVTAGDTWTWTKTVQDYAPTEGSGTWTLSYAIVGVNLLTWSASWVSAGTGSWTITIPASATSNLAEGRYTWTLVLTGGGTLAGRRATPLTGVFSVLANPALAAPGDGQTFAEAQLTVVEAVLAGRITADIQAYSIGGRSVTSIPFNELYLLRNRLRTEVWRERNPGKAMPGIFVAFRQPGSAV